MKRVVKPHVHCLDVPRELRRTVEVRCGGLAEATWNLTNIGFTFGEGSKPL